MSIYKIEVPGPPIAKKRPRFVRIGKFVKTYNPQETEEGRFLLYVNQRWKDHRIIGGPIQLECTFYMPIPKSTSKKNVEAMLSGSFKHIKRPDCDNLVKFVKDCLNGVVWRDDSQVYKIVAEKVYGKYPFTMIVIIEDENNNADRNEEFGIHIASYSHDAKI